MFLGESDETVQPRDNSYEGLAELTRSGYYGTPETPDGYTETVNSSILVRWTGSHADVECARTRDGWDLRLRDDGLIRVKRRNLSKTEAFQAARGLMEEDRPVEGDLASGVEEQVESVLEEFESAEAAASLQDAMDQGLEADSP